MIPTKVFEYFKECLPVYSKQTETYFPNGKNSIRIRQSNGQEFIFSINGPRMWKLETVDQFLADMKGDKNHE